MSILILDLKCFPFEIMFVRLKFHNWQKLSDSWVSTSSTKFVLNSESPSTLSAKFCSLLRLDASYFWLRQRPWFFNFAEFFIKNRQSILYKIVWLFLCHWLELFHLNFRNLFRLILGKSGRFNRLLNRTVFSWREGFVKCLCGFELLLFH